MSMLWISLDKLVITSTMVFRGDIGLESINILMTLLASELRGI